MATTTAPTSAPSRLTNLLELLRPPSVSLTHAWRLWTRNAVLYRTGWVRNVLPNFIEPLLYLLAIGLGLGLYVGEQIRGVEYSVYLAPGLAAVPAMYGAMFETTYNVYVKLQYHKVYDAVITTPLEAADVALGEVLWAVTRSAIYTTAFVIVMTLMGLIQSPWALLALALLPLLGLTVALIGLIYSSLIPTIDFFSFFFGLFVMPMFLFSGIFFPIENLPRAAQLVAWLTPLHHGAELSRSLVLDGDPMTALAHASFLAVFAAVLFVPAINLFRRRLID